MPEWKLIHALEPDFHFKPEVELYNLITDPGENHNLAEKEPEIVALLEARMAGDDDSITAGKNWRSPPELSDRGRDLGDLLDTVRTGVPGEWNQLLDRPRHNL